MKSLLAALAVVALLLHPALSKERQIRSKSILLPISQSPPDHRIEYVTQAYGGCYHWSTNEPKVLKVQGITTSNDCESKAVLRLQHDGGWIGPLTISAKDRHSEDVVRADVRLSRIVSIDIVTKFRVMSVGQVVEFYVTGFDSEHNTFSSLKGFKFEWTIELDTGGVERVSIKDSGIHQETNYRKDMEALGHQTDMFVLRAYKIGQLKLRAKLKEPKYEGIEAEIPVSVQERFDIDPPSPVYLLTNSKFKFRLINSAYQTIEMPNTNYQVRLSNGDYEVSPSLEMRTPIRESQTTLTVEDTRTRPGSSNTVEIFSYEPDTVFIKAQEFMVVGQEEPFSVQFYYKGHLLNGNISYSLSCVGLTLDKQRMTVKGDSKKLGVIEVMYGNLKAQKHILVNLPLKPILFNPDVLLPVKQDFQLSILGGSQSYLYSIEPKVVAEIDSNGVITALSKGKAIIHVTDFKDSRNTLDIPLSVESVKSLRSLQERKEVARGGFGEIVVLAEALSGRPYTQCNSLNVSLANRSDSNINITKVNTNHQLIAENLRKESQDNAELKTALNQLSVIPRGYDIVKEFSKYVLAGEISIDKINDVIKRLNNFGICSALEIQGQELKEQLNKIQIEDTTTISPEFAVKVYPRIQTLDIDPNVMDIVLTPRSELTWKIRGGPSRWDPTSEPKIALNGERVADVNSLVVKCGQKVEVLTNMVTIENPRSSKLLRPDVAQKMLTVYCRYPSEIKLKAPNTTMDGRTLYITKSDPFELNVEAYDNYGRRFLNNSNLHYVWELKNVRQHGNKFEAISANQNFIKVTTDHVEGEQGPTFPKLSDDIQVRKLPSFSLHANGKTIETATLVLHPFNKLFVDIRDGSNRFAIACPPEVIHCIYRESPKGVEITPIKVGQTFVRIVDSSVYGTELKTIQIFVVDPVKLVLTSNSTLVEEDASVRVTAQIYGQGNREIDYHQFKYLNVRLSTDCIAKETERTSSSVVYKLTHKGSCQVYGHIDGISRAGEPTQRLDAQNPIRLEIYKKFTANMLDLKETVANGISYHSANLNLALGCNSLLTFSGGPEHKLDVANSVKPAGIVTVTVLDDRTYQFRSLAEGEASFKLTLVENGVLISETNIRINVRKVTSVEIMGLVNGRRDIHEGATVRLVSKIMIGDHKPADSFCPLIYEWKSPDKEIIKIGEWSSNDERYANSGVNVTALGRGTAIVELVVRLQGSSLEIGNTKAIIKVVGIADVDVPTYIGKEGAIPNYLLLPPHSVYKLPNDHRARLVSPCDKFIHVNQNSIETFDDKKSGAVQITTSNGEQSANYLTVVVSRIYSIFIDNPTGVLNLQLDGKTKVKFYVQDQYGRLFPNNVLGVNYILRVSNPHILSAVLTEDRSLIELKGLKNGSCQLLLFVQGMDDFDIVPVRVGHLIRPVSPIFIHEGGIIQYEIQEGTGEWDTESSSVVSIDKQTGRAVAHRQGSTEILFKSGMVLRSRVHVSQVTNIVQAYTDKEKNFQGKHPFNITYHLLWRNPQEELRQNLNNPFSLINNNLVFKCESKNPDWFEVYGGFSTNEDGTQVPYCTVQARKDSPVSKIPANLAITVTLSSNETSFKLGQVFNYPYHFEFAVPNKDKVLELNPDYPTVNVTVDTNEELQLVDSIDSVSSDFSRELRQQTVRVDMSNAPKKFAKFTLRLRNPVTNQQENIVVRYDPAARGRPISASWVNIGMRWTDIVVGCMILAIVVIGFLNWQVQNRPKLL